MGFGYLFIGYLLAFNFTYRTYTDIFSVLLMLLGLSTLKRYAKGFSRAFYAGIPFLAVSFASFTVSIGQLLGLFSVPLELSSFFAVSAPILQAVFLFLTLLGVSEISRETDIPVLDARALRNRIFTPPFYGLAVLLNTRDLFAYTNEVVWVFALAYMLFGLLYTFLNAKLFFECYMWICLEGDESMERKPSRFALINKLNEISDRLDEKTLARKERERREREARRARRAEQKNKEGKKK
jgi:hypothetical protein